MVNTRRNNQGGENLPPPPPVTLEQLMMMQTQLLRQMAQNMHNHGNGNAPHQVRHKRGEFLKVTHLFPNIPLTHSKLMIGCVQLRGNLRLHNVMIERRFCMLLGSYRGLHLTSGTLSILVVMRLIPSVGKSFAVPSAIIMCLLD